MAEKRLGLGGEADLAAEVREEERPDAETVPREQQLAAFAIPDGDRKVAVEPFEAADAPLLVGVRDDLGVGDTLEPVAAPHELHPQLDVVIDLAVLHHPVPPPLVAQRLVTAVGVDDGEPRVRHPERAIDVETRRRQDRGGAARRPSRAGEDDRPVYRFVRRIRPKPHIFEG